MGLRLLDQVFEIRVNSLAVNGSVNDSTPNITGLNLLGTYPNGIVAQILEVVGIHVSEILQYFDITFPDLLAKNNVGAAITQRMLAPFMWNKSDFGVHYFPDKPISVKIPGFAATSFQIAIRNSSILGSALWAVSAGEELFIKIRLIGY